MKIKTIDAQNFMMFESLSMPFSDGINVIFGENSTGKTAILKALYSSAKVISDLSHNKNSALTKDIIEKNLVSKMVGVFRPENDVIGRLVGRLQGSNRTDVKIEFSDDISLAYGFGNRQSNHIDINKFENLNVENDFIPIYIPPKEIISIGNITSLYDDFHIEIEETYYDLARLLLRPLKKGPNTNEQTAVLSSFNQIMNGQVVQKDNRFFLKVKGSGEFEMGLVSEGYRKLSTLTYLILSGSLNKSSILFWDEPESNMNPKMIYYIAQALVELAKMGVQIFVTTHSYFVQQAFNLIANYPKANPKNVDIKFISLFKEMNKSNFESANNLNEIKHNSIMEEFDEIYNRELELNQ